MSLLFISFLLFSAGFVENMINSWHIRAAAHGKTLQVGVSGTVYVLIWAGAWFSAVQRILADSGSLWIIVAYAFGSGLGSMTMVWVAKSRGRTTDAAVRRAARKRRPRNLSR